MKRYNKGQAFLEYALVLALIIGLSIKTLVQLNNTVSSKFGISVVSTDPLSKSSSLSNTEKPIISDNSTVKNATPSSSLVKPTPDLTTIYRENYERQKYGSPTALIIGPTTVTVNTNVTYYDKSYSMYNTLVSGVWSYYKNGVLVTETKTPNTNTVNLFKTTGTYIIKLTVKDNLGASSTCARTITVVNKTTSSNNAPVAYIRPLTCTFQSHIVKNSTIIDKTINIYSDSYDIDGSITKLIWEYQDNGTSVKKETSATGYITITPHYLQFYDIKLTAVDDKGATNTTTYTYQVIKDNILPKAVLTTSVDKKESPTMPDGYWIVGTTYTLYDESIDNDGKIIYNNWGTGRNRVTTKQVKYDKPGTYTLTLTVTDNVGDTSTVTKVIHVDYASYPVAVITMTPSSNINTSTTVVLSSNKSYDPDPDGVIAGEEWQNKLTHYTAGTQTVKLRVKDQHGMWSTWVSKTFTVKQWDIIVTASMNNTNGTFPTTYHYDNGTYAGDIPKDGAATRVQTGGQAGDSKSVSQTKGSSSNSFSANIGYNDGTYSGTLYKSGSVSPVVTSGSAAASKWVSQTKTSISNNLPSSIWYNDGSFSGTINGGTVSSKLISGSYTAAYNQKVYDQVVSGHFYWLNSSGYLGYTNPPHPSSWMGGASSAPAKPSSYPTNWEITSCMWDGAKKWVTWSSPDQYARKVAITYKHFKWVYHAATDTRVWQYSRTYSGTVYKPDTRTYYYYQNYAGTVYKPDTRIWLYTQNYKGKVYLKN